MLSWGVAGQAGVDAQLTCQVPTLPNVHSTSVCTISTPCASAFGCCRLFLPAFCSCLSLLRKSMCERLGKGQVSGYVVPEIRCSGTQIWTNASTAQGVSMPRVAAQACKQLTRS